MRLPTIPTARRLWNHLSAPTCFSFPWTTSGAGTATITSLPSAAAAYANQHETNHRAARPASEWYETNGQELEAFQHAVTANDVARAVRLIEGEGLPFTSGRPVRHGWHLCRAEFGQAGVGDVRLGLPSPVACTRTLKKSCRQKAPIPSRRQNGRLHGQIAPPSHVGHIKNEVERIVTQSRRP